MTRWSSGSTCIGRREFRARPAQHGAEARSGRGPSPSSYPQLLQTVFDCTDARPLAEFYRRLLGLVYREGDEPGASDREERDWLVLLKPSGERCLAFQQVDELPPTTWPEPGVPQQFLIWT